MGPNPEYESEIPVPLLPDRRADHETPGARPDHQHFFAGRTAAVAGLYPLLRFEGGFNHVDKMPGARTGPRNHGEQRGPRYHPVPRGETRRGLHPQSSATPHRHGRRNRPSRPLFRHGRLRHRPNPRRRRRSVAGIGTKFYEIAGFSLSASMPRHLMAWSTTPASIFPSRNNSFSVA